MRFLIAVFLFVLVQVISSQTYDDLAKDECFKKIYVCGDYRTSVTSGTGRLATEPHRFSEVCRKHKEFIACIEQAADFCSGQLTNISRMILDNRRSLKIFCTDFEWKRNYFSSAKCINDNEKAIVEKCLKEEEEYKDNRPYWCLIPEPCEALERVFMCTVQKMKLQCGSVAAEVHRRMHILKMENRDIVCKIRQNNPLYCRYRRQRPSPTDTMNRVGTLSVELSKAINNIFEASLVNTMDHFSLLFNEENLSNVFDSEEYQLRAAIFKSQVEEKFGPFFKQCKLPKGDVNWKPDLSEARFMLLFANISEILSKARSESSKLGLSFYENIFKSCRTDTLFLASCIEKLNELGVLSAQNPLAGILKDLNPYLKSLYRYIIDLFEFLSCKENFLVNSITEDSAFISWDIVDSFPIQTLSCGWKENAKVFQCFFKLKPSDLPFEEINPETESTTDESMVIGDHVNEFLRPYIQESSLFTDSGSGMEREFIVPTDEHQTTHDSSTPDTIPSEVDEFDIHRSGEQMVFQEELDSDFFNEESDESKNSNEIHKEDNNDPTVNSPTDSVSYVIIDENTNTEKPLLDSIERSPSHASLKQSVLDTEETDLEKENLKLQLRKIVSALNKRFDDVEVRIFDSKDVSKSYSTRSLQENQSLKSHSDSINESFSYDLENFLKDKMNEYISVYSIYSNSPLAESNMRGDRTKRDAMNERKNSKLDKSFKVDSSNESARINSKFMNLKAEL